MAADKTATVCACQLGMLQTINLLFVLFTSDVNHLFQFLH
jgi:hypothetical protein